MFFGGSNILARVRDAIPGLSTVRGSGPVYTPSDEVASCGADDTIIEICIDGTADSPGTGAGSIRSLLILAAESAFDMRVGNRDSVFAARFEELALGLEHTLSTIPSDGGEIDFRLPVRRARKAVSALRETMRREILEGIEEGADMATLERALRTVKKSAVEAAVALTMTKISTADH